MGCTVYYGSDSYPYTIVDIQGNTIMVTQDFAKRTDRNGISESQEYEYRTNPNAVPETFTKRKNGAYVRKGESINGTRLYVGKRRMYQNPSF